jgi:hypothetical protein
MHSPRQVVDVECVETAVGDDVRGRRVDALSGGCAAITTDKPVIADQSFISLRGFRRNFLMMRHKVELFSAAVLVIARA